MVARDNKLQRSCMSMQTSEGTIITKANGERELFDPHKLHLSLVRSGAEERLAQKITSDIASTLNEGDLTRNIYRRAFAKLKRAEGPVAARYSVKHALLELGPSGYPFESFLAEIYKKLGYNARTRVVVRGRCVEHELDVIAVKGQERIAAEVKFHNNSGIKSDIKVALYVQARFEDIAAGSSHNGSTDYTDRLLITNTEFTKQVEEYAACVGLQLLGWDYPAKGNLRELIEETGVHPVSCLTTLSRQNKRRLMEQGIVLCSQLREHMEEIEALGVSKQTIQRLFVEIDGLCR